MLASLQDADLRRRREEEEALQAVKAVEKAAAEKAKQERQRLLKLKEPAPGVTALFQPYRWLSDACISFVYSRLKAGCGDVSVSGGGESAPEATFRSSSSASSGSPLPESILLMEPAEAHWLVLEADGALVDEARSYLELEARELILCPVNDDRDGGKADAGKHWGLLVWDRRGARPDAEQGRFVYYDSASLRGANYTQAKKLAGRLGGRSTMVTAGLCAKQTNGFDCGMYVLLFSEIVVAAFREWQVRGRPPSDAGAPPCWEKRLVAVTPLEVSARREFFSSTPVTVAALGG